MISRAILPALAAGFLVTGCAAQDAAQPQASPAPPVPPTQGTCGAEKVTSYIGSVASDEVLAKIKSASGAQALRVVGPNDAMTMDFREDRLTITTGEDKTIKTLRCV